MISISSQRKNFYIYFFIFIFALILRNYYLWEIKDTYVFPLLLGDAKSYEVWAQDISKGEWIGNQVFYQAPFYPYFLATIYSLVGRNLFAVRLIQILLGATACLLVARAGRYFFSNKVGISSGLLLAVYPTAIFFDCLIQKAVLNFFFMALLLLLLGKIKDRPSGKLWFLCGLTLGSFGLTRENALILIIPIGAWLLIHFRFQDRKKILVWCTFFLMGLSTILLPVAIRNKIVGGDLLFTTSQFGTNLYIGNHESASGMYEPLRPGRGNWKFEREDATALAQKDIGHKLSPKEVSRYWTQKTLSYIQSNPGGWLHLMVKKWLLFWNFMEISDTESQYAYYEWSSLLKGLGSFLHFGIIAPLAVLGICVTLKDYRKLWLLYLVLIIFAASVTLFYIFDRYRHPIIPLLVLFSAAGLTHGYRLIQRKEVKMLMIWGLITLAAGIGINWKIIPQDQQHFRSLTLGNMCFEFLASGNAQQAVKYCTQSARINPHNAKVLNNLGAGLIEQRKFEEAIPFLLQAVKLNPQIAKAHFNLGVALAYLGKPEAALGYFEQALRINPGFEKAARWRKKILKDSDPF
ncbi:MAG: tetratricopeptide repeat protein [Desulfobacterales bacterium]|jgi:4-amino-4-deoxy-L-arabinose transferase-like glycosyltransferase